MTEREERDESTSPLQIKKDDFSTGTWPNGQAPWHHGLSDGPGVEPKITKLPPNGPAAGQSMEAWLYGKNKNCQRQREAAQWRRRSTGKAESENSGA